MPLTSQAVAALAAFATANADVVETITNGTSSAVGIRSTQRGLGELELSGVSAPDARTVWVKTETIGTVTHGWTILVSGVRANVLSVSVDPGSGHTRIDYTLNSET